MWGRSSNPEGWLRTLTAYFFPDECNYFSLYAGAWFSLYVSRYCSKETLLVKTFAADEGKVQVCSLVDLSVMTRSGLDMCLSLLSIPTICEPLTGQLINHATSRFQYLSGLDLADSSDGKDCLEVGVLIGVDQYWKIVTGKVVKDIAGPTAIETAFGWVLSWSCTRSHL